MTRNSAKVQTAPFGIAGLRAAVSALALMAAPVTFSAALTPSVAHAQASAEAIRPINALYAALDRIQSPTSGTMQARAQIIGPVVDQAFDLSTVLHNSIGMRYTTLSSAEQQKLLSAFREFTVARYVSSFKKGGKAKFTVSPTTRPAPVGGSTIVNTTIGGDNGAPTTINYVMQPSAGSYRIVDVLLAGNISQVAAQRADFSSTLARGGVDALVGLLNRKTQNFMNG